MPRTWKTASLLPKVLVLIVSLCLAARAVPARAADEEDLLPSALHAHARALEFEPRISFSPSATISGKYHLTARTAVRLGFIFDFESQGLSNEDHQYVDTLVGTGGTHLDRNSHRITAFAHLLRYGSLGRRFGIFGFAGPTALRDWNSEENDRLSRGIFSEKEHDETLTWGVGVDVGAGFEWFFSRRLSLGAQYGLTYLYSETRTAIQDDLTEGSLLETFTRESRGHGFDLVSTPAVLLLSGYF